MKKKKWLKWVGIILLALVITSGIYVYHYLHICQPADTEALQAMISDEAVIVTEEGSTITFTPTGQTPTTGLVYYPGGQVEPESFAYAAHKIAQEGYLVVIQKMPYNLAILDYDRGLSIPEDHPEITNWYLSGFSLGGTTACMLLSKKDTPFQGLILYASYTTNSFNLKNSDLSVLSISGSNDGLSTPAKIETGKAYLPDDTSYLVIEGGNHTQFAIYGNGAIQKGDNPADIDRMDQQKMAIEATVQFLDENS